MSGGGRTADATVSVRNKETLAEYSTDWGLATTDLLSAATPWRTFRWHRGQKHYQAVIGRRPRVAMSSTSRGWSSPGCMFADFDRSVHRICAQPFLLVTRSHGRVMKIIP